MFKSTELISDKTLEGPQEKYVSPAGHGSRIQNSVFDKFISQKDLHNLFISRFTTENGECNVFGGFGRISTCTNTFEKLKSSSRNYRYRMLFSDYSKNAKTEPKLYKEKFLNDSVVIVMAVLSIKKARKL